MEIKASSKYDWETIKKFNNFNNYIRFKALKIVVLISNIVLVAMAVLLCVMNAFTADLIGKFALVLFVDAFFVFTNHVYPKIQYNKSKLLHGMVNEFTFGDDAMLLEQNGENANNTETMKYSAIWKVYEAKDNIYIYINPNQSYIVDKSTIVGGTVADLRAFLMEKVGTKKYKIKCKNL